ncbi:GNAT family N-acetyltransferase [Lacticaseibacillus brantae]|uniref:N-acetyltransferase domain-containing protein n=1 Tax=Lacticaseibacillus brantae DSM 23927 TaxID=1423727 RepID=A0A0R2AY23_9LACO|nr:GNAT family N-acetyltransferase [Lacticaseibacillus brantae]KRM72253.1 hypothetical protein FC34_GL001238 [Lacticaseibacillus brantae DSM 23927]
MMTLIRHFQPEDFDQFAAIVRNPRVATPAGLGPLNDSEIISQFQTALRYPEIWAVIVNDQVVGQFGAYDRGVDPSQPDATSREIGFFLAEAYWGQGIMGQALELGLTQLQQREVVDVWAGVFPDNTRSQQLLLAHQFDFQFEVPLPAGLTQNSASAEWYFRRPLGQ